MTARKVKTPSESESYIAEIVGNESLYGERMSAGKILHMMDMAAASAAVKHAECPVVTLAFDRIELPYLIYHMDYVRFDAYVIKVGRSSIVVKVDGYTKSPTDMEIQPAHSGVITMVAVCEDRKPNKEIPSLEYKTEEDLQRKKMAEQRDALCNERHCMLDEIDSMEKIDDKQLKDIFSRKHLIPPEQTGLVVRNIFLPRNANAMGVVFGGDTIEMMEELALATARQFTGNFRMVTIAMEDVLFLKPVNITNLVEMSSVVTFVSGTTLTVEITVKAVDFFDQSKSYITNSGVFTVLNYDRSSSKKNIHIGLDMSNADIDLKKSYLKEKVKYENRKKLGK